MSTGQKQPFFLVGCEHSGVSELKNILKRHPNLVSLNDMSFYQGSKPVGVADFKKPYLQQSQFKQNWREDGFSSEELSKLIDGSASRKNLSEKYAKRVAKKRNQQGRWFDASTSNIYGLLLLKAQYPQSKIVYLYRHPYDVIASLLHSPGSQLDLLGATNYWLEAMLIISSFKRLRNAKLIELKYEDFMQSPSKTVRSLLSDLEESTEEFDFSKLRSRSNKTLSAGEKGYASLLTVQDKAYIFNRCKRFIESYEYDLPSEEVKLEDAGSAFGSMKSLTKGIESLLDEQLGKS